MVGAPQTYKYFHDMQSRIERFVAEHSSIERERLNELMMKPDELANDVGSIVEGREAVELGIIDELGGLDRALAALKQLVDEQ